MSASIQKINHLGHEAVEIVTAGFRLVAVTDCGPRIAHWSLPGGENLLFWDEKGTLGRGAWKLRGGHRLWVGRPGADEAEETYAADNGACAVEIHGKTVTILAPEDAASRTRRGFTLRVLEDDLLEVTHRLSNLGPMLYSGIFWPLTCSLPKPGTRYVIPLGDGSEWDSAPVVLFRKWAGHGTGSFHDDQFRFHDTWLEINPAGRENKRMVQARAGLFVMDDAARGAVFAKQSGFDAHGTHPFGCNLAAYVGPDNFMVEMESMSGTVMLRPGESAVWTETWHLRPRTAAVTGADALRLLPA